jgi:hypothetical protein
MLQVQADADGGSVNARGRVHGRCMGRPGGTVAKQSLGHTQSTVEVQSIEIKCKNQRVLGLLHNPVEHQHAKHINVVHHFERERMAGQGEGLRHRRHADRRAIKELSRLKHIKFSKDMGTVAPCK